MLIDGRTISDKAVIDTDICIVGAGVAGITLAHEFVNAGFQIIMLESGGFAPDIELQSLNWGENIGIPYYPLDIARIRAFGGTSHRWHVELGKNRLGVRLRGLDEIDFEEREWVPYSGWPFDKKHLDPYYERAHSFCKIGPYSYEPEDFAEPVETPTLPFQNGRVKTTVFQFAKRDVLYNGYKETILKSENIKTYIHSTVVNIAVDEHAKNVTQLEVKTLEGKRFFVKAKLNILATGGLEIPRLMLQSNKVVSAGVGNEHDLVGRFFMEHPHHWSGIIYPASNELFNKLNLYKIHDVNDVPVMGKLTIDQNVLRKERMLNYTASIHPKYLPVIPDGVRSLKDIARSVKKGKMPSDLALHVKKIMGDSGSIPGAVYRKIRRSIDSRYAQRLIKPNVLVLNHMCEQIPNPESRVLLDDEKDMLGMQRVKLCWKLTKTDIRSMIRAQEIIGEELRRAELGNLLIEERSDEPPEKIHGGWHHMGTTRMHDDPKKGVVDRNSKMHGMSNLYIAGSSVFPTGGYANPVLTIVALSIRLAEHIRKEFRG